MKRGIWTVMIESKECFHVTKKKETRQQRFCFDSKRDRYADIWKKINVISRRVFLDSKDKHGNNTGFYRDIRESRLELLALR